MKLSVKTLLLLPCLLAVPVCNILPSSAALRLAVAAENPTSGLTDIILPRGPVPLEGDATPFVKVLKDVAAQEAVNIKPAGDEAEVWVWENEWGGEAKGKFTQGAVQAALRTGGYTPRELTPNDVGAVNLFSAFDLEDSDLAFRPSMPCWDTYFVATNEERGSTIVGMWLQNNNKLALALLPLAFKAKPKPKPLPKVTTGAVVVKNPNDTMASLPRPTVPKFAALTRKPRMVRGWLKDATGKPVVGAEVAVHSSIGGGLRTTHKARSNAQGLYEVLVPTGIAEVVQVDKNVTYNGKTYTLYLEPALGSAKQFNSTTGHVENYILSMAGKGGGTIRFTDDFKSGILEVTLSPIGLQMDGSKGHTLIYRLDKSQGDIETYLKGVPMGRYKFTARLFEGGEEMSLRVRRTSGSDEERAYKPAETVDFGTETQYIGGSLTSSYFEASIAP